MSNIINVKIWRSSEDENGDTEKNFSFTCPVCGCENSGYYEEIEDNIECGYGCDLTEYITFEENNEY